MERELQRRASIRSRVFSLLCSACPVRTGRRADPGDRRRERERERSVPDVERLHGLRGAVRALRNGERTNRAAGEPQLGRRGQKSGEDEQYGKAITIRQTHSRAPFLYAQTHPTARIARNTATSAMPNHP